MEPHPNEDRPVDRGPDAFDTPWKEAMQGYLPSFAEFFFPMAYADIDWDAGYESLDTELRQIAGEYPASAMHSDSLFRVKRKSGAGQLVLFHAEAQTDRDPELAERMFRYSYRSFEAHGLPVASFAVLGDHSRRWRPERYGWSLWGCEMTLRFPVVKLIDWKGREEELLASRNPFALITQAFLSTRATRKDDVMRRRWKLRIVRRLYEQDYTGEDVRVLFRVIDWMMRLEGDQEIIFKTELDELEAERRMPYVTSIERIAKQEGRKEAFQESQQKLVDLVMAQLRQRFGNLPEWAAAKLKKAAPESVETWALRIVDARSLEEVFA